MKKLLSVLAVIALLLTSACSAKEDGSKKLKVLTSSGYKPYEVIDENGNLSGFDIDVVKRVAEIAGYEIQIQDVDFDAIVPSVKTGKADLAIAAMSPTKARRESVDFSDIYYASGETQNYVLYKESSGIQSQADLDGKTIGCQMGSVQFEAATYLQDNNKAKVDAKKDYASIIAEINKGNNDCAIVEKDVAISFAKEDPEFKYFKLEGLAKLEGNAMCFKKDSKLIGEFNKAIQEMKNNGEMDKLIKKYFK